MWPNPKKTAELVTFTEEILNGKLHFLSSEIIFEKIEEFIPKNKHQNKTKNIISDPTFKYVLEYFRHIFDLLQNNS